MYDFHASENDYYAKQISELTGVSVEEVKRVLKAAKLIMPKPLPDNYLDHDL